MAWSLGLLAVAAASPDRDIEPIVERPIDVGVGYSSSHALLVGMSRYKFLPRLPGVRDDLEEVREALEAHHFTVEVVVDVTRSQLMEALHAFYAAHRDRDSRLLVYFAGHGFTSRHPYLGEEGFLVPFDVKPTDEDIRTEAIPLGDFERFAKRLEAKHALFAFDACFAGTFFRSRSPSRDEHVEDYTNHPERYFLTAGDAREAVPDQSLFREYFVRGIGGAADLNDDGVVTGTELGQYLHQSVVDASRGAQHPRHGQIRDPRLNEGEFVFDVGNAARAADDEEEDETMDGQQHYEAGVAALLGRYGRYDGSKAARSLRRAAAAGHVRAAALLADVYYLGADGGGQDHELAWKTVAKPYELGDPYARFLRAKMQFLGLMVAGGPQARETGEYHLRDLESELERLDVEGDPFLTYARAWIASRISGDQERAVELYAIALEAGHISAINNLALHYEHGLGVRRDLREAFQLYQRAADLGSIEGVSNLGLAYEYGIGVDQDLQHALRLYERAALLGNPQGMLHLGRLLEQGVATEPDEEAAATWYRRASEYGERDAMVALGRILFENDSDEAYGWFLLSADLGNPVAMTWLGYFWLDGFGSRPSNPRRARHWFSAASEAGDLRAAAELGVMMLFGLGGPREPKQAVDTLWRAVKGGEPVAMIGLGDAYANGMGVRKSLSDAKRWYEQAAFLGHPAAPDRLARLERPKSERPVDTQ